MKRRQVNADLCGRLRVCIIAMLGALLAGPGAAHVDRTLVNEAVIDAPTEIVWELFTTTEGIRSWMAPVAEIDLRVGGSIRASYNPDATLGGPDTIVNTIISFEPSRMLSIRNTRAPDGFENAHLFQQTWSVIHFEPVGEARTRVRCVGLGYGEGPEWDRLYDHFKVGNDYVLSKLQQRVAELGLPELAEEPSPSMRVYLASVAAAHAALRLNETANARRWLDEAPPEHRGWEWSHLLGQADQSRRTIEPHDDMLYAVTYSPDGTMLAAASGDQTVSLLDASTGAVRAILRGHEGAVYNVAFSPDGRTLASCSRDMTIRLWDTSSFEPLGVIADPDSHIMSVAFSPDGTRIVGSLLSYVKIWNVADGALQQTLEGHVLKPPVVSVVWSHDGRRIASGSWDNLAIIWDAETGDLLHKLGPGYGNDDYAQMKTVAFSPDDTKLVAAASDGTWFLWDASDGSLLARTTGHEKDCLAIACAPDGARLATASQDGLIRIWDVASRQSLATLRGHTSGVRSVAFSPDGATIASAGEDQSIRLWSADPHDYAGSWPAHEGGPWGIAFSPDGGRIATVGSEPEVRVWDARTHQLIRTMTGHAADVTAVAWAPDGRRVVTGSNDGTARTWNLDTGEALFTSDDQGRPIHDVGWSADGRYFAACINGRTVIAWDASTNEPVLTLEGHPYRRLAFSPRGARLATTDREGWVRIWDVATGEPLHEMQIEADLPLNECAFSPDGGLIAVTADDRTVRLWDIEASREVHVLGGMDANSYAVRFLPDGSRIVASVYDSTVRLWDVESGRGTLTIPSPEWVWTLDVSPDGSTVAWGPVNGTVVLSGAAPTPARTIPHANPGLHTRKE